MSAHEGVSCDACGKSNFRSKRFKCLICYDYDLCATCHEQGEVSSDHTTAHPMQCILTRQDYDLYYHGERYTPDQPQSLTCPYCGELGFSFPYLNEPSSLPSPSNNSTQNLDLLHHLQSKHANDQQSPEVICPICAAMVNGEPNLVTGDLLSHVTNDHQHSPGNGSSSTSDGLSIYSRQGVPSREYDFSIGTGIRAGFRRGSLRATSRRGGLGRGGGPVSQHFVVDASGFSASGNGNDPIADLLTQLSSVRRLAASNNTNNSSTSQNSLPTTANTINLQALTRQQYERERLRATLGRSHHHHHHQHHQQQQTPHPPQASGTPENFSLIENDLFDSLLSTALFADPFNSSTNNHRTWTHLLPPSQSQSQPQLTLDQQSQTNSAMKVPPIRPIDADPSLLRRLCEETSPSAVSSPNTAIVSLPKAKSDFVQCLLLSSFASSSNDKE